MAGAQAAGARGHGVGAGTDGDDSPRVVEDRRAGEGERAAGVAVAGRWLPLGAGVRGRVAGPASAGISNSSITQSEQKTTAPAAEWLSVSKIGNNPKNGLSRAVIGGVERPAEALAPLAADDSDLPPLFRPPSTLRQPPGEKCGLLGACELDPEPRSRQLRVETNGDSSCRAAASPVRSLTVAAFIRRLVIASDHGSPGAVTRACLTSGPRVTADHHREAHSHGPVASRALRQASSNDSTASSKNIRAKMPTETPSAVCSSAMVK